MQRSDTSKGSRQLTGAHKHHQKLPAQMHCCLCLEGMVEVAHQLDAAPSTACTPCMSNICRHGMSLVLSVSSRLVTTYRSIHTDQGFLNAAETGIQNMRYIMKSYSKSLFVDFITGHKAQEVSQISLACFVNRYSTVLNAL